MKGTMTERTPGTWQLRVYAGRDPKTNNPIQVTKTFKGGKRAAQSALSEFVTEVEQQRTPLTSNTTVAELIEKYIEYLTPLRSPTTIRGYRTHSKRVVDVLGRIKVSKLTAQDLDRAYRGWLAEGLASSTVHHFHSLISAALNQAVRWGVVPFAVTERATPPPLKSPPVPEIQPATIRQLIEKAKASRSPLLPTIIALAAITGARRGEMAGLRWSDLDTDKGLIWVRRSIKRGLVEQREVGPTKTHAERAIALDSLSIEVLASRAVEAAKAAADAGVDLDPDGYILSLDPTGLTPMRPDSITQAYRRVAKRAGIKVRFHDLRHFAATQMIGAGIDPVTTAGRLGHADPSITMRLYAAAIAARDREAGAVLGKLVLEEQPALPAPAGGAGAN